MREINTLIIHCSATRPAMDIGAEEIRGWHVNGNGWADIGYHYVIRRNGIIETGRDVDRDGDILEEVGAHAYGFNRDSVGICLVGGVDENGKPDANYTRKQWESLGALVDGLVDELGPIKVIGHRDVTSGKSCPCFDVLAWNQ